MFEFHYTACLLSELNIVRIASRSEESRTEEGRKKEEDDVLQDDVSTDLNGGTDTMFSMKQS